MLATKTTKNLTDISCPTPFINSDVANTTVSELSETQSRFAFYHEKTYVFYKNHENGQKSDIKILSIAISSFVLFITFKIVFFSSDFLTLLQVYLIAMLDQQTSNSDQQNREDSVFYHQYRK